MLIPPGWIRTSEESENLSVARFWDGEREKELQRNTDDPVRKVFHKVSRFTYIFLREFGENAAS